MGNNTCGRALEASATAASCWCAVCSGRPASSQRCHRFVRSPTDPPSRAQPQVFGVLDGHGREVGKLAATAGRDGILAWLDDAANMESIRLNPTEGFAIMFAHAHSCVKEAFRESLTSAGWTVEVRAACSHRAAGLHRSLVRLRLLARMPPYLTHPSRTILSP